MSTPQHPGPPVAVAPTGPPARPKRRLWLIVGVVSVLVAAAGVTATLYATGFFGDSGGSAAKIDETGKNGSTSIKELSSPSPDGEEPKYRYRDGLCAEVDWKPLEKLTGLDSEDMEVTGEPSPGNVTITCVVDDAENSSSYNVEILIKDSVSLAKEEYETMTPGSDGKEAEGPWSQGVWSSEGADEDSAYVYLHAQDSNAYLKFSSSVDGGDSADDIKAAVTTVTGELLTAIVVKG